MAPVSQMPAPWFPETTLPGPIVLNVDASVTITPPRPFGSAASPAVMPATICRRSGTSTDSAMKRKKHRNSSPQVVTTTHQRHRIVQGRS